MDTRTKIAIAMRQAHGNHQCTLGYAPLKEWKEIPPERQHKWLIQADAAIDVMMAELADEKAKAHGDQVRQSRQIQGDDSLGYFQSEGYLNKRYKELRSEGKTHAEAVLLLYYEGAEEEAIARHIKPANLTAKKGY